MGPLAGMRVIDLSPNRVGAQISQMFADFGADVIQVEPPGGAIIRLHAAHPFWGQGKQSIVVDERDECDRQVIRDLARGADIFIETHQPGVLDALGLGFGRLGAANPRLIYASVTGFRRQGPYANAPGYEGVVHAKLGVFDAFRRMSPNTQPPFVNVPFASFAASQVALHGILAALIEREHSGAGQWVETNLVQAFMTLDTWAWFEHLIAQRWPDAFHKTDPYDELGRPASYFTFMLLICLTRDGSWLQFASVAPHLYAPATRTSSSPPTCSPRRFPQHWPSACRAASRTTTADTRRCTSTASSSAAPCPARQCSPIPTAGPSSSARRAPTT